MKHYGIFIAYPPTVDMGNEGLGRYLAAFLKGAAQRDDLRFVLVCPSWSRGGLDKLLAAEAVPTAHFDIVHPPRSPFILRAYEALSAYRQRRRQKSKRLEIVARIRRIEERIETYVLRRVAGALSFTVLLPLVIGACFVALGALLLAPLLLVVMLAYLLVRGARVLAARAAIPLAHANARLKRVLAHPEDDSFVFRLYKFMEEAESKRMLKLIDGMPQVRAWYCPTAFWPAFNKIRAPKLMCVPDVVLREFGVDFCQLGGDRFLTTFEDVEATIRSGTYFTTYSDAVKWETLVDGYAVNSADVTVIRHAPNDLGNLVVIEGFAERERTSRRYCEWQLERALRKSTNPAYANDFPNGSIRFLFYASQFRPNKNLISLLRAYEHLLRNFRIDHKLILTGKPSMLPAVEEFIRAHGLENDVLCVHGLSVRELAACYRLADIAVNPSLSEGGCPFTFAEALSVGTPVVMARIGVTQEVLVDQELQEKSLFDPYDWRDIAGRIEWAVHNRAALLAVQQRTYLQLSSRKWVDVVNEHVDILDRISA